MKRLLVICTGNAGRSQIAAALLKKRCDAEVLSAGVEPWDDLHPVGRELLVERGYSVDGLYPKHVETFGDELLDVVVTIGDRAGAETPRLAGCPDRLHWPIDDPADADGSGREREVFEKTWALIEARLPALLERLAAVPDRASLHLVPGLSTCITRPSALKPAEHLPAIAAAGFRCLELCLFFGSRDAAWDNATYLRELRTVVDDCGLHIYSVHSAGGLGCMAMGHSRTMARELIKVQAELACELGASVVPMHAGPNPQLEREVAIRQLREDLDELAAHVRELPCRLGWENEPKGLTTQEHLDWLRDLDPASFGLLIDPGHANIAGTTDAYWDHGQDLLCGLHLNDNDGQRDAHWLPGAGTIDWDGYLERLARCRYHGPLMLEVQADDRQHEFEQVLAEAMASLDVVRGSPGQRV